MARVAFTPTARAHLRQIQEYIAQDSPTAAKAMVRRLRGEAGRLATYPAMGRIVPEYDDPNLRELIVAPYRLVYRFEAEANVIRVLGIVHGSRLLPRLPDDC